uniref:hypothetical protein n=1 Tax=uncultured Draconibacterium sp. TaxID=1573823 RepID=UPI003217687B
LPEKQLPFLAQPKCGRVIFEQSSQLPGLTTADRPKESHFSEGRSSNKVMLVILDCSERKWKLIGEAILYTQIFTDPIS